jgi:uncharacterized protein (DUF427 family)
LHGKLQTARRITKNSGPMRQTSVMKPTPLKPGPGQESVWDYPRPPRLETVNKRIQIIMAGVNILDTTGAFRVLETSHPPTYYLPPTDFLAGVLEASSGSSFCEWKGQARYANLRVAQHTSRNAAWSYPNPTPGFKAIKDFVALYSSSVLILPEDGCFIAGERVRPQPGGFYGGWITTDVLGPFKGDPNFNSHGW